MIGSVEITNEIRNESFMQRTDFMSFFYESEGDTLNRAKNYISQDIEIDDLLSYFSNSFFINRNRKFYKRLLNEVSNFLYYSHKEHHTTAFIYIYRTLEIISFSFPLIYASQTEDFKHTYGFLKKYFDENKGDNNGELGFFKSFILNAFKDNPLKETSVDFDLSAISEEDQKRTIYIAIKSICGEKILHTNSIEFDQISINFTDISSFIITIRNRFFHLFNRGDRNLESDEIFDSELLFQILNEQCFAWIAIVYLEILKYSINRIQS